MNGTEARLLGTPPIRLFPWCGPGVRHRLEPDLTWSIRRGGGRVHWLGFGFKPRKSRDIAPCGQGDLWRNARNRRFLAVLSQAIAWSVRVPLGAD